MSELKFKKGDLVNFVGKKHFKTPTGKVFFTVKPGVAKITAVAVNGVHPYHLVATEESQSTVNGWVDEEMIQSEYKKKELKVVSFSKNKQTKICLAKGVGEGIEIDSFTWQPLGWTAVCRPRDPKNAEQIAHMAEVGCAKKSFEGVTFTATTLADICLEAASLPINGMINKNNMVNSGLFNIFTSDEYTTKSEFLRRGDILLGDFNSAIVLSNGKRSNEQAASVKAETSEPNTSLVGKGIGFAILKDEVKVHSGAGEKFEVIGFADDTLEVLAIDINNWFRIVWPEAQLGCAYVDGSNLKFEPKEVKQEKIEVIEASEKPAEKDMELAGCYKGITPVYVRDGAGIEKGVLGKLPKGIEVRNYGFYTEVKNVKWLYVQIKYKDKIYNGFVSGNCLIDN